MSTRPLLLASSEIADRSAAGPEVGSRDDSLAVLLGPPSILCAMMVFAALVTAYLAHIDFSNLFVPYFSGAGAVTLLCIPLTLFWWVGELAIRRADDPLRTVFGRLRMRLPLLLLPFFVGPLFLVAYTSSKTAIPFLVGYGWETFWANADRLIFGEDVWRITHRWLGTGSMAMWEWFYTVAWGGVLTFTMALVALNARPRAVAIFYTAMLGTWFLGGFVIAYMFSAAGPIFAHVAHPGLGPRFAELRHLLDGNLSANGSIRVTQHYLSKAFDLHTAVKGGGISAFPSMHVAAASIYVLAARRTWWIVPALFFWAVIFVASGYFGYHYWIDGLVAAALALLCWAAAERYFGSLSMPAVIDRSEPPASLQTEPA